MNRVIAFTLLLAACGGAEVDADAENPGDVSSTTEATEPGPGQYGADRGIDSSVEDEFARFVRQPILIDQKLPSKGLKIVLNRELSRYSTLSTSLKQAYERQPEAKPVLAIRQAQLFARMGCTVVQAQPPNQLAADQLEMYERILAEQAHAVLSRVPATLQSVPAEDPLRWHADVLAGVPETPTDVGAIRKYCGETLTYWHDSRNELSVDEVEPARCEKRDAVACYVWAELGSGGPDAMAKACELGALVACPEDLEGPAGSGEGEGKSKVFGIIGSGE